MKKVSPVVKAIKERLEPIKRLYTENPIVLRILGRVQNFGLDKY